MANVIDFASLSEKHRPAQTNSTFILDDHGAQIVLTRNTFVVCYARNESTDTV